MKSTRTLSERSSAYYKSKTPILIGVASLESVSFSYVLVANMPIIFFANVVFILEKVVFPIKSKICAVSLEKFIDGSGEKKITSKTALLT